jgi:trans-aconitate 2-methyltransferase
MSLAPLRFSRNAHLPSQSGRISIHNRINFRSLTTSTKPSPSSSSTSNPQHKRPHLHHHYPFFRSANPKMSSTSSPQQKKKDWSATQYLKFNNERTRAVYDLVSQITPHITSPTPRIYDLGCGPGNSTKVLKDAFPDAQITGMDSSPDMLEKATAEFEGKQGVEFVSGDLGTFEVEGADLVFSNAVFHWLRSPARIPTLVRLFEGLKTGGVVAIQVPDNYNEHSHRLMRETASMKSQPWSKYFANTRIGDLGDKERPDLDPIEPPSAWYDALVPHASSVRILPSSHLLKLSSLLSLPLPTHLSHVYSHISSLKASNQERGYLRSEPTPQANLSRSTYGVQTTNTSCLPPLRSSSG